MHSVFRFTCINQKVRKVKGELIWWKEVILQQQQQFMQILDSSIRATAQEGKTQQIKPHIQVIKYVSRF